MSRYGAMFSLAVLILGAFDCRAAEEKKKCPGIIVHAYAGEGTGVDTLENDPKRLPRGSAVRVPPGKALRKEGIYRKILAALGSGDSESEARPSLESIQLALSNALTLAAKEGDVALSFLGRGHFLKMLSASKKDLATAIFATLEKRVPGLGIKVVVVANGSVEAHYFNKILEARPIEGVSVVIGSLHTEKTHGCHVIIEGVGIELGKE